jgi:hypothetical protein
MMNSLVASNPLVVRDLRLVDHGLAAAIVTGKPEKGSAVVIRLPVVD